MLLFFPPKDKRHGIYFRSNQNWIRGLELCRSMRKFVGHLFFLGKSSLGNLYLWKDIFFGSTYMGSAKMEVTYYFVLILALVYLID